MADQSRYGKVTDDLVALLSEIVGNKNILTGRITPGMKRQSQNRFCLR